MPPSPSAPPPRLPPSLARMLADAEWQTVTIGMSGAQVYAVRQPGRAARYVKTASGPHVVELRAERDRLRWLAGRLPVPAVEGWAVEQDEAQEARAWLLLSAAPGRMACDPNELSEPQRVVTALAQGLRRIHRLPVNDCPFDARLDQRLAQAEWVIAAGISDEEAVQESQGVSASELLQRLIATRPAEPAADLVFTHSDYCLPNVLLDPAQGVVNAYLDWGRAGVADRYQDLAIGARSVRHNLGAEWEPRFLTAYQSDRADDAEELMQLDLARLAWYELLDELF